MLKKQNNISSSKETSKDPFAEKEKEFLDLICSFIVDNIINKVNDDKEEGNSLRED